MMPACMGQELARKPERLAGAASLEPERRGACRMSKTPVAARYPAGVGPSPEGRVAFRKFVAFIQHSWSDETKFPVVPRGSKMASNGEWLGVRRIFRGQGQIAVRPEVIDRWSSDKIVAVDVKSQLLSQGILIPGSGAKYTSQIKLFEDDKRVRLLVLDLQKMLDYDHRRSPPRAREIGGRGQPERPATNADKCHEE